MKINRAALLSALKLASPALASDKNAVEELFHFWFDGKNLSAYDGLLGVKVEFPTEFTGGIKGDKLLGVLENSRVKEVSLEPSDEGMLLKAGRALITFQLRPIDDWFWQPQVPDEDGYDMNKDFLSAISLALLSVGSTKIMNPEQRGITVIEDSGNIDFYSTDSLAISWIRVGSKSNRRLLSSETDRCIVPTQFCQQLIKVARPGANIVFDESAVYLREVVKLGTEKESTEADVMIFSSLVEDENPLPFQSVVGGYIDSAKGFFEIPSGQLRMAIDRALVMLAEGQATDFKVEGGHLYIYAKTDHGEVDDEIKLEKIEKHPDISVRVDFSLLKRALEDREKMTVTDECLILTGPKGYYHIIACK